MIGRLKGLLLEKKPPLVVIDCHGVGYEVEVPMTTFWRLPEVSETVSLYTHLAIRDDAHLLYGFSTDDQRALFRNLLKVSGVGTKMALAILSGMDGDDFRNCIRENDISRLTALPGIGKKTAERLLVEMRDRVGSPQLQPGGTQRAQSQTGSSVSDAVSGLIYLGYKPQEASRLVGDVEAEGLSSSDLIREVLRNLAAR